MAMRQICNKAEEHNRDHDCRACPNDLSDLHELQSLVQAMCTRPCKCLPRRAPDRPVSCGPDIMNVLWVRTCLQIGEIKR